MREGVQVRENEGDRERNSRVEREISTMFNIGGEDLLEEKSQSLEGLVEMPVLAGCIENEEVEILVDSGSQVSCVSKSFLEMLVQKDGGLPRLPISTTTVVGALNSRGQKVTEQVFLRFQVGEVMFDFVCLVVPGLRRKVILRCDWLVKFEVVLSLCNGLLQGCFEGERKWLLYKGKKRSVRG